MGEPGERVWIVDDLPNERFPIWTRGNVGEVFPEVVSPLTWSLFGTHVEEGWRDAMLRFGGHLPRDYEGIFPVNVGVFGGYCYLNVSAARVLAVRTPGLSPEAMDRSLFGESEAPPYRPAAGDKSLLATLRCTRTLASTLFARRLPELDDDKAMVADWRARQPNPAVATDAQLHRTIDEMVAMFRSLFARHLYTSFRATVPAGVLTELCVDKLGDPGLVVRLLGSIGDVESAEPARHLWRLGRVVAGDPTLTSAFDDGRADLPDRLATSKPGAAFLAQVADFQERHGARGPNEWEGSAPVWGTDVGLVLAAIDSLRRADEGHEPARLAATLRVDREAAATEARRRLKGGDRRRFDLALRSGAVFSQGRERTKTTVVTALHCFRLAALELARRAIPRGAPTDPTKLWLVTAEELDDYLTDPPAFACTLQERADKRDHLAARIPPFVFVGTQPDPSTWPLRADAADPPAAAGDHLQGISGCPGVATGRARVVLDPSDPRGLGPGDVLVAPITDPSWTPLFLPAEAVIVDVGAQMSHAVIVSRELGIPCVVSVTGATTAIPDGALVEVDGTNGTVKVIKLP